MVHSHQLEADTQGADSNYLTACDPVFPTCVRQLERDAN